MRFIANHFSTGLLNQLPPPLLTLTFVVLKSHVDDFQIDETIKKFYPQAKIVVIEKILPGAVCTCLEGCKHINDDLPIIFNDCDHMFSCKSLDTSLDFDGALLTFESQSPQFSYIKFDDEAKIIGTVEKEVVSNQAICGAYVFKNVNIFREATEKYFETCQYNEFFMSGVYNELIKAGKKVINFKTDFYLPFGTPTEFESAKESKLFAEVDL